MNVYLETCVYMDSVKMCMDTSDVIVNKDTNWTRQEETVQVWCHILSSFRPNKILKPWKKKSAVFFVLLIQGYFRKSYIGGVARQFT